jgi:adenylate cyclase, class 2
MTDHDSLEVEVKFYAPDLTAVRHRLLTLGAEQTKERVYERNVRFDNEYGGLLHKRRLLRLRQDGTTRLTFKGDPPQAVVSEAKVREELELTVSDFDTAVTLLQRLGFQPVQIYEKYRETFQLGPVEVVLDELPFGNFIELEGEEAAIRAAAANLGLEWSQRILYNYLYLMALLQQRKNLPFADLTFDNFKQTAVTIADILELLAVGS